MITTQNDLSIPWRTPALWHAVHFAIDHALRNGIRDVRPLKHLAGRIRDHINALDGLMDDLCARTCPACSDPCCRRATVWYDFRDLLYLHLIGCDLPPEQLLAAPGEICRYLGSRGCVLDRIQRPFVCTWYLCPAQTRSLRVRDSAAARSLDADTAGLKACRRDLEDRFIQALVQKGESLHHLSITRAKRGA